MKLYFKYVYYLLKSQLQFKASFVMTVITQFIQPFALFAGIYFLFERFGSVGGWSVYEVFLCYAVVAICFSIAECFARGFDKFPDMIRNASFDRVLVRPRSALVQVLGAGFDIKRIGAFAQGGLVLAAAIILGDVHWDIFRVVILINMIIGGVFIFTGIYLLQATAAFWTVEGLEVANIFTHGIRQHASYPLDIFPKWITAIFTFVIPFGTVNYIPLRFLLGKTDGNSLFFAVIPLIGSLFIIPCLLAWRFGVSRYSSAGS